MTDRSINSFTLSVTQLNKYVCSLLDGDRLLNDVFVQGEISNIKFHSSGHIYFSLKDEGASIDAALFRQKAAMLRFRPENGMAVICRGKVSIYDKTGKYQIYVDDMQPVGAGSLAIAFEQLKEKLLNEGLFDSSQKKRLPQFPEKIAVVTSPTGAAVHDILSILARRYPYAEIVMCPVKVQGDGSAIDMCRALIKIQQFKCADIIIIGRGGGSAEDLWEFNDERLAREIYNCTIPIISAVGHETDYTICDFVADVRAATPSAAAEIAVPDISELYLMFNSFTSVLKKSLISLLKQKHNQYCLLAQNRVLISGLDIVNKRSEYVDLLCEKMKSAYKIFISQEKNNFEKLDSALSAFDPTALLKKGYAQLRLADRTIKSVNDLNIEDNVTITLADGSATAVIKEILRKDK